MLWLTMRRADVRATIYVVGAVCGLVLAPVGQVLGLPVLSQIAQIVAGAAPLIALRHLTPDEPVT